MKIFSDFLTTSSTFIKSVYTMNLPHRQLASVSYYSSFIKVTKMINLLLLISYRLLGKWIVCLKVLHIELPTWKASRGQNSNEFDLTRRFFQTFSNPCSYLRWWISIFIQQTLIFLWAIYALKSKWKSVKKYLDPCFYKYQIFFIQYKSTD